MTIITNYDVRFTMSNLMNNGEANIVICCDVRDSSSRMQPAQLIPKLPNLIDFMAIAHRQTPADDSLRWFAGGHRTLQEEVLMGWGALGHSAMEKVWKQCSKQLVWYESNMKAMLWYALYVAHRVSCTNNLLGWLWFRLWLLFLSWYLLTIVNILQ